MRLPLVLLALAASQQPTHGLHSQRALATTYPACTAAQSKTFTDNLGAVSSGCANSTTYDWDGDDDPTPAQRTDLCKCTVGALSVPKCHWTKLGQYDVSVSEHFNFAYNCSSLSGKASPKLTEVDAASYTPAPTTAAPSAAAEAEETPTSTTEAPTSTTAAPPSQASTTQGSDCTVSQLNAFTGALNTASSGCMGTSSYNWGGSTDPTEAQYKEICKCASVTSFTIPACYIQKAQYRLLLSDHYNWVTAVQCPTFSPSTAGAVAETKSSSSSNVGLIAGVAGGVVAVILVVVIGFFLYRRHRNEKEEDEQHYRQPHNDMNAINATRPQVNYQQDFQQAYQQKRARPPVENINTI